jgi:ABC-2 type transport system permease protein
MRAVHALWLRELKRYWRSKQRVAMTVLQPVMYLLIFGFGMEPVYQKAGAGSFMQFLAPGIIAMTVFFSSMGSGSALMLDRQFGVMKEILVTPVPRIQIMIGCTCGAATIAALQGLVVMLVCFAAGFRPVPNMSAAAGLLFIVLIATTFSALGSVLGASMKDMRSYMGSMNFLAMPLTLLSGIFFPLENLPALLSAFMNINPLSYGVDGLRATLIEQTHFGVLLDAGVLLLTAVMLLAVGAWRFSRLEP